MQLSVALLTIGSELLDGRVLNTNAHFIADLLAENGIECPFTISCGDTEKDIVDSLHFLADKVCAIITSGGIGPTTDDLTREAVATFINEELVHNEQVLSDLVARYAKRGRTLDPSNNKQALFPGTSTIIPNANGTAPGFCSVRKGSQAPCRVYSLPGVPSELRQMLQEHVLPDLLRQTNNDQKPHVRLLRVFGRPESELNSIVGTCAVPHSVTLSYRAHFPEIQIRLKGTDAAQIDSCTDRIAEAIGEEFVFSTDKFTDLPATVHRLCVESSITLGLAESCTGGFIAKLLTDHPGSSAYLLGGVVSYSNDSKVNLLDVKRETLSQYGAVSKEVAHEMAIGSRDRFKSSIGISVTGIAGPEGGSEQKPVGTFYLGFATNEEVHVVHCCFPHDRQRVRQFATHTALETLRRHLLNLPLRGLISQ